MTAGDEIKPSEVKAQTQVEKEVTPPKGKEEEPTKASIRNQMWAKLESSDLVLFPRPCKYRIPRIKGENEAVERLAQLDIFKSAKVVKVNLDKAHERVRLEVIQSGKELVAGTPGLREAVFLLMRPPMEPNKMANKMAASRIGIHHLGMALDFSSESKADLVILGSVAVDKKGHRIGKGEGFSDLEYALLSKLGAISPNAVIATIVHDVQVYDEFPESMFKPHDVPVDVIVTPTQVIEVEKRLPRPSLMWNLLSNRRVNDIPIIRQLLDKEQLGGNKIELKEVDSEPESQRPFLPIRRRRFMRRRRQASAPEQRQQGRPIRRESSAPPPNRSSRTFRRRPRRQLPAGAESPKVEGQRETGVKPMRRGPMRRISKPRYTVDFSIRVNGLTSSVRIRDLKAALIERGVRPNDISWRATKGVALLHFAKRKHHVAQETIPMVTAGVDEVVASLQGLSVKSEDGPAMDLSVEAAKPIVRAEPVAEATAV
ncbi:methenyltetrahydrofolate synthase domain-containing protein isoform X2 [Cimex lectularius]|uniref:Methenyltetrahydrofolate synthase domain-containing protein n=1 Tax=Cimex lectularius TaxID=79782 RepID=A0A8I6TBS9_CIMLE|nr:methenyltetrahydrofolate synthase domain-containing protein isoform X2 [Cimex lectularius]